MAYTVQKGDTLYEIAKRYNTTVEKIAKQNNISNPSRIYTGQTLNFGGPSAAPKTTPAQPQQSIQPQAVAQAWNSSQASAKPSYSGLSADDYTKALLDSATSGINSSYNSQMAAINQNLADFLSNLNAEKATNQANLDKQIESIHNNEFATSEAQKEAMNQAGWNMNNSGLAVGEMSRIKMGADKQRSDANGSLALALQDIARRTSDAQGKASNDKLTLEKWKADQLTGAQANALMQGDQRNYQQWRDSMSDWMNNRNFDYQVSRDKVLDDQWMKQFTASEQQRLIQNAIQNRQISVDEGRLALEKAAQDWSKDPTNPDNIYKNTQNDNMKSGGTDAYKNYMDIGLGMKNAVVDKLETGEDGTLQKVSVNRYTDADILKWVTNLDLSDDEKARLLNTLGIKEQ